MGFRFRKSINIVPGVRVNLSGSGASLSVGPRGASVSFGKRGAYANLGLPGTGLSYRTRLNRASSLSRQRSAARQENDLLRAELEQAVSALNQAIDEIINIHLLTPDPCTGYSYSELERHYRELALKPFSIPAPIRPKKPELHEAPARPTETQGRGFISRIFESAQAREERIRLNEARWMQDVENYKRENELALKRYQANRQQWAEQYANWQADAIQHEKRLAQSAESISQRFSADTGYFESLLAEVLNAADWPRETMISYQVQPENSCILLDVDLPEIEDMPTYSVRVNAKGTEIIEKEISQKSLRERYALHIHGVLLRLAGIAFCALPFKVVKISGFTQRISKQTGHLEDEYLISACIERKSFEQLNFNQLAEINPVLAFERFNLKRKMSATYIFQSIVPLI